MKPDTDIERILFDGPADTAALQRIESDLRFMNFGDFHEIHWLNTPGPIYTTCTDNCGTGQPAAPDNVGEDEDGREVLFRQPLTGEQLETVLDAAMRDPFGSYYFDGNQNWNADRIRDWWQQSDKRISFILDRYEAELARPLDRPLYGYTEALPESYKNWLDFYQDGMKNYLEWYAMKLGGWPLLLEDLKCDWRRKQELDAAFAARSQDR